jgi:hypothetical protein
LTARDSQLVAENDDRQINCRPNVDVNVNLIWPRTGKSHLSIAIGICACMQSRRTRFTTAAAWATSWSKAKDQRMLSGVIGRYARYDLLVLDELAYVPLSATEAELLFQVLDERSERAALVTNTICPSASGPRSSPSHGCARR